MLNYTKSYKQRYNPKQKCTKVRIENRTRTTDRMRNQD